jgi:hypothetical protein
MQMHSAHTQATAASTKTAAAVGCKAATWQPLLLVNFSQLAQALLLHAQHCCVPDCCGYEAPASQPAVVAFTTEAPAASK